MNESIVDVVATVPGIRPGQLAARMLKRESVIEAAVDDLLARGVLEEHEGRLYLAGKGPSEDAEDDDLADGWDWDGLEGEP